MQELNKTKAALQGRQCHYTKQNQSQLIIPIDRVNQSPEFLGDPGGYFRSGASGHKGESSPLLAGGVQPLPRLFWVYPKLETPLTRNRRHSLHLAFGFLSNIPNPLIFSKAQKWAVENFLERNSLIKKQSSNLSRVIHLTQPLAGFDIRRMLSRMQKCTLEENQYVSKTQKSASEQNQLVISGGGIPPTGGKRASCIGAHPATQVVGSSLAFLRWRRLISLFAAVIKKPAVLSSPSLTCSINSKSSSGSLTETCRDLLFLLPVAITESPVFGWCSVCMKNLSFQLLTWCSPLNTLVVFTLLVQGAKIAKPSSGGTLTGPLTTNDRLCIEAATMNHITPLTGRNSYTSNKFTWRFLALSAIGQSIVHITATTEREARNQSPAGCVLVFAARLPVEVRHV